MLSRSTALYGSLVTTGAARTVATVGGLSAAVTTATSVASAVCNAHASTASAYAAVLSESRRHATLDPTAFARPARPLSREEKLRKLQHQQQHQHQQQQQQELEQEQPQ